MKKLTSVLLSTVLLTGLAGCSSAAPASSAASSAAGSDAKVIKVAVVKQLDHASLDEIAAAVIEELNARAAADGYVIEYSGTADLGNGKVYSGQNDQTQLQQIGTSVVNDNVDVIIPIATMAAQTMTVAAEETKTPVVFAAISDPEAAGLTGIDYVTGTSDALNTVQIFDMMFAQNPDIQKVALLYSKSEANSAKPIEEAKKYLEANGIAYEDFGNPTNRDEVIQTAAAVVAAGVDTVFTPTDNVIMDAELTIAQTFAEAGILHYTGADSFVRNGAFTTCGVNYTDLGKHTADLAYDAAVQGIENTKYYQEYETMPGGIITVNTETAEKLGADYSMFSSFGEVVEVVTTEE